MINFFMFHDTSKKIHIFYEQNIHITISNNCKCKSKKKYNPNPPVIDCDEKWFLNSKKYAYF